MLMYVDAVMSEIADIRAYALLVQQKFEAEREASELLLDARVLEHRLKALEAMMPSGRLKGEPFRRTQWMLFWLEKNQRDACRHDIDALIDHDFPEIERQIKDWSNQLAYVDADLRRDIMPLLRARQFDSVIRKAFVVLKTRLCDKFNIDHSVDGTDLVNRIFGKTSPHFAHLDPGVKQAYRDLFAGVFGLLRNGYAHNDLDADLSDLDAVIANVNLCLRVAGDFRAPPSQST